MFEVGGDTYSAIVRRRAGEHSTHPQIGVVDWEQTAKAAETAVEAFKKHCDTISTQKMPFEYQTFWAEWERLGGVMEAAVAKCMRYQVTFDEWDRAKLSSLQDSVIEVRKGTGHSLIVFSQHRRAGCGCQGFLGQRGRFHR